jgi:hypothetical protein
MHCPRCKTEYELGVTRCSDCELDLAEGPAPSGQDEPEWVELVTVLETGDPSLLMVTKSLLDVEGVPSFVEGVGVYEGLGAGRIAGADLPMGPGRLRVRPENAEAARELLATLQPLDEAEESGA